MDDELIDYFVASIKPKMRERKQLSSVKSFEEACIALKHAGLVFMEYIGATQDSSNDDTYTNHSQFYALMEGINQIMNDKP